MLSKLKFPLIISVLIGINSAAFANEDSGKGFYERSAEGWFWHEPLPEQIEEIEEEIAPPQSVEPSDDATVKAEPKSTLEPMTVAWFRENLPKAKIMAINSRSPDDVKRYLYMQRAAVDVSTEFMTQYIATSMFDPYLNESLRRPETGIALTTHRVAQDKNMWELFKRLGKNNSLIYFYSSSCAYCATQTPYLSRVTEEFGWDVLPVSIDGGPVPNDQFQYFENYKVATPEMAQTFNVVATPTLYLVDKSSNDFYLLSSGLAALTEIVERSIQIAKRENLLTQEEYNEQAQVKEMLMTNPEQRVDTEQVYDDPNYLIDLMRKTLTGNDGAPHNEK
ncbi:conjugal transfer protein TraF [Shewanella sp. SG44-6]|jgi:conjugal transfer pilus assembly protein TraF|uniref:conjugal transfer protein TraF n=1 Tax=Shewanella sp. SG44-6 TaxID=2760959 RepID=UPI00160203CB|nr:conjugal transfer protein TraF [Shewanella sp. SG44-6]MBB1388763.1 conjugal transfer protein TraF [Shewanella sp. SG44-6]